jgi:hypothetical protein
MQRIGFSIQRNSFVSTTGTYFKSPTRQKKKEEEKQN